MLCKCKNDTFCVLFFSNCSLSITDRLINDAILASAFSPLNVSTNRAFSNVSELCSYSAALALTAQHQSTDDQASFFACFWSGLLCQFLGGRKRKEASDNHLSTRGLNFLVVVITWNDGALQWCGWVIGDYHSCTLSLEWNFCFHCVFVVKKVCLLLLLITKSACALIIIGECSCQQLKHIFFSETESGNALAKGASRGRMLSLVRVAHSSRQKYCRRINRRRICQSGAVLQFVASDKMSFVGDDPA